ncbi:MAG: helix-hairpin-helix domain-containing protein [Promethearchaeota archaeon]
MTDTNESLLGKKLDLKVYYDLAQRAFDDKDLSQAKIISENGLKKALLENNGEWTRKFTSFNNTLNQFYADRLNDGNTGYIKEETEKRQESVSVKEDLTIVKGIGKTVAEKLFQVGITSIRELASIKPRTLMKVKGIGSATAMRLIEAAKMYVKNPSINRYTRLHENSEPLLEEKIIENDIHDDSKIKEELELSEKNRPLVKNVKWFDDKYKRPSTGIWIPPLNSPKEAVTEIPIMKAVSTIGIDDNALEIEDIDEYEESQFSPPIVKSTNSIRSTHQDEGKLQKIQQHTMDTGLSEKLNPDEIEHLRLHMQQELNSKGYYIIIENHFLTNIFQNIDILALKIIQVNATLDLLLLLPIRINSLRGSLLVSEESVNYHGTLKDGHQFNRAIDTLLNLNLNRIIESQEIIFNELISEGNLFQFFHNYLKLNITVEKTITKKRLFFRAGPLQYKILIEPIIVSQGNVGFTEKLLPFAYQKHSNLHLIEYTKLTEILPYLEKKYYAVETRGKRENDIITYFNAIDKFMEELRLYSFPFIGFGIALVFALLSQVPEVVTIFINLGFALLFLYGIIAAYLYYKFFKTKRTLQQEYHTPYFQKLLELDETDLILINEELTEAQMTQFSYECLGKHIKSPFISQLEINRTENLLIKGKQNSKPIITNSTLNPSLIKKYSSFLED